MTLTPSCVWHWNSYGYKAARELKRKPIVSLMTCITDGSSKWSGIATVLAKQYSIVLLVALIITSVISYLSILITYLVMGYTNLIAWRIWARLVGHHSFLLFFRVGHLPYVGNSSYERLYLSLMWIGLKCLNWMLRAYFEETSCTDCVFGHGNIVVLPQNLIISSHIFTFTFVYIFKKWKHQVWNIETEISCGTMTSKIMRNRKGQHKVLCQPNNTFAICHVGLFIITSAKEVMFSPEFVCLSVCLSVSNIIRKVVDGFGWYFQEMSAMGPGTTDDIVGVIRTRCHWLQHLLSALSECFSSLVCILNICMSEIW